MKCPLCNFVIESEDKEEKSVMLDCLKEECAWWNADFGTCVLHALRDDLKEISGALQGILLKMPPAGQFRK